MQLAGVVGIVIGLILFARTMETKAHSGLVDVARFSAITSVVFAAALQAVDGWHCYSCSGCGNCLHRVFRACHDDQHAGQFNR
jgi:hypothetical protein